jgi:hypothetical protein
MPYLRQDNANLRDALANYYPYAEEGDMIKSHDEFAVFSKAGKWEGNLTYMKPGCGYLFYRQAETPVLFTFPFTSGSSAATQPRKARRNTAATNMTMIAMVKGLENERGSGLEVYLDDQLVGRAEPMDSLYYVTVQSDKSGVLRFKTGEGTALLIANPQLSIIHCLPNAHYGSPEAPVILAPLPADELENGGIDLKNIRMISNHTQLLFPILLISLLFPL